MKKFLLFLTLLPSLAFAAERSAQEAAALAAQFMNQQVLAPARKASMNASSYKLAHTRQKLNSTEPAFYVFNNTGEGYVVVSADDRTEDVLMYSEEGTLDVETANPNLKFWLNRLQEEISVVNDENGFTPAEKKARKATTVTAITPLLKNKNGKDITWDQEKPYWNQCPMDLFYTSERCLTGCVATATAQIMYKWRYPAKGTGEKTYTWVECSEYEEEYPYSCLSSKSKELSKDFSTVTFDWDNMLPAYAGVSSTDAQKNAVATLMYCCGVASEMEYGGSTVGGSGAWTDVMADGLVNYFGYKAQKFLTTYSEKAYGEAAFSPAEYSVTTAKFKEYFNADLEAGRPILMGGEDSDGGHEFVCDGRNSSGYFHINWGWEGEGNNYCLLTALQPSGSSYNFSSNIDALIGLEPAVVDTVHVTGITVAPTTLTLKQKEKASVAATIAPTDATVKTYSWSSSDTKIATVSAAGQVVGVAQGEARIIATAKDGGFTDTCFVTVTEDTIEVTDCAKYSYTFTKACQTGSNTLGDYTWNITLDKGSIGGIDSQNGRGQQFGSRTTACEQVSLTTANTAECLINTVKVNASMGSQGDGQLAVYIGGTQVGSTQSLTSTATDYTFSNTDGVQGNLEIRLTNSAKAMYIKTIEVNPDGGEDPVAVTGVTLDQSSLSIQKGAIATLIATVKPENATNKNVTWSSDKESIATVSTTGVVTAVAVGTAVITVKTEDGNYTATCSVTVTEPSGDAKTFKLVTTDSDLKENLEVLIVNIDAKKAISTKQNSNNRATADVTISKNQIELAAAQTTVEVFKLVEGTVNDSWAFQTSAGKYIYAASDSKNYLRTQDSIDANASFTIAIASEVATITAQGTNTHNTIMYNEGNKSQDPLFSCYLSTSTTMKDVAIFAYESKSTAVGAIYNDVSKQSQKVLLNGQLYILYEGNLYNAQGNKVK